MNWSAHSPLSSLAATTHKFQASVCSIPIIPPCWWYQGRRGSQQGSHWGWLTLSADTEGEVFSAHRDLIIHFPVTSSPAVYVAHLWFVQTAEQNWTATSATQNWGISSPEVPNIIPPFNFASSLQLLKCDSKKAVVKTEVFQLPHLINKETSSFLLSLSKEAWTCS